MTYVGILLVAILIWLVYEWTEHAMIEYNSTVVEYQDLKQTGAIRLCLIADLHNNKKDWKKISTRIQEFQPDLILLSGDLVNKHSRIQTNAIEFLKEIQKIAPVYYSLGNHEERLRSQKKVLWEEYVDSLPRAIHLLDNTSAVEYIRGKKVSLSGLSLPEEFYCKGKLCEKKEKLPELSGTPEGFHILLAHHPEYADWYKKYQPDFVVSGHLHGGLLRLPILGGVISPRLRIPREDAGSFDYSFGKLFITRGLGSHTIPLRFFNRVEISFIILDEKTEKRTEKINNGDSGEIRSV